MLILPPLPYRPARRIGRRDAAAVPVPVPVAPTLVAASFDADGPSLRLTFDRAIGFAGLVADDVVVLDGGEAQAVYRGTDDVAREDDATIVITMQQQDSYEGFATWLEVGAGNGIVATDGGEAWTGVADQSLPFP